MADPSQLMDHGVVIGFSADSQYVQISNGVHVINAFDPTSGRNIQPGQTFTIYRQGNLYFVGNEVPT